MERKNFVEESFMFIGALDSARTAHLNFAENETKNSWWIPENEKIWQGHCASAEALTIKQIIWGDVIALSRNQFFDSPPWFSLAEYLLKLKFPAFSITIYPENLPLEPVSYVKEISNTFINSSFALSGWPLLEKEKRQIIGKNIARDLNFNKMFDGVEIDSSVKDVFEYQREMLQKVHIYLTENYKKPEFRGLISRASGGKTSLWEKIQDDITDSLFVEKMNTKFGPDFSRSYLDVFSDIYKKAQIINSTGSESEKHVNTLKWVNQRTNLYQNIFDYDVELRSLLRQHIDKRYNDTLSESCTGIGRNEFIDRLDTKVDHEFRDSLSDTLDSMNDPNGFLEDTEVIFSDEKRSRNFLADVVERLNEEEVSGKILDIRIIRSEKQMPRDLRNEFEYRHLDFMSKIIPDLVVDDSASAKFVRFTYNNISETVIILGLLFFPDSPIKNIGGVGETVKIITKLAEELFKSKIEDLIGSTIQKKGEELILDNLFKKKKNILTGKVRNWLGRRLARS